MPVVFHSALPRAVRILDKDEIQDCRKKMTDLESQLRQNTPSGNLPTNNISLSGSFPVTEIAAMIAQNPDCSHLSFMTGYDRKDGHFTIMVPMKDVIPGDEKSGTIIDNPETIYSAICCQHPPFIDVSHP
jgi:hypothetical protein